MIHESVITSVLERADLLALVGERVALRRSGSNHVGLCPFHNERTPSFVVSPQRGRYHCFGCGADGDAIDFVRQTQHLDFVEAVRYLAERAGIALHQSGRPNAADLKRDEAQTHQRLYDLIARVHDRYQKALQHVLGQHDHPVASYCRERGITQEVARRHGLGLATADALDDILRAQQQDCIEAGLARWAGEATAQRLVACFRARLVFPIRDDRGRVVAFSGRIIPGLVKESHKHLPKYLNSPETSLYQKSELLYRFSEARPQIIKTRRSIVVEGYMDALALSEAGFEEAVACCGTALTEKQLAKLLKVSESVFFVFDGDEAGQRAALKAAKLALSLYQENRQFRFVTLPGGQDPDEFIQTQGAQAFERAMEGAPALSGYLLDTYARLNRGLSSVEDRVSYLKQLRDVLEPVGNSSAFARLLMKEAYRRVYSRPFRYQSANRPAPPTSVFTRHRVTEYPAQHQGVHTEFQSPPLNTRPRNFWHDLSKAIEEAPATAREMGPMIEEILNLEDTQERQIALTLRRVQQQVSSCPEAAEGAMPKDRVIAADLLRSAPRLIAKKRMDAALDALKQLRDQGGITEEEYLRSSMYLIEASR